MTNSGGLDGNMRRALFGLSSSDGVTPVNVYVDPTLHAILTVTSGSGLAVLTATGTVNQSNQAFTFASEPTFLVVDGIWLQQTDNNGNTQWSWNSGTKTATLTNIVPQNSIWGL